MSDENVEEDLRQVKVEHEESTENIPFLRSVGGKLMLLVGGIILLTAAAASIIDYTYIRKFILDEIHSDLEIYVASLSSALLRNQENEESLIEFVVQRNDVLQLLEERREGNLEALKIQDKLTTILAGTHMGTLNLDRIRLLDTKGEVVAADDPAQIGSNLAEHVLFQQGKDELYVTFNPRSDQGYDMVFSTPIVDDETQLLGVAVVEFHDTSLQEIVEGFDTRHASSRVRIGVFTEIGEVDYVFMTADANALVDALPAADEPMARALAGATGFMDDERDYRGVKVVSAYRPVGYGGLGIVAQVDASEVYAPLNATLIAIVAFGFFFAALSVVLAILVVDKSTNPLLVLVDAAQKITRGDFSTRVDTNRRDEIGSLSVAFNRMSDSVERNTLHLEDSVRTRTRDLEQSQRQLTAMVRRLEFQAEIMDRDLARAEVIQHSLLPSQPPSIPGITLTSLYLPCKYVGGDLYDVVRIDNRHIGLLVADAAGHGVSAAMLSVLFKNRIDIIEREDHVYDVQSSNRVNEALGIPLTRHSAIPLFQKINLELIEHIHAENMFVTAVFCILDIATKELTITNAGHPPLIVLRASDETEIVNGEGPALGLYEDAEFNEVTINLEAGDRVLLYTDGLFDLRGMEHRSMEDVASHMREFGPDVDALEEVVKFAAGDFEEPDRDDVTLLMMDVRDGQSSFQQRSEILDRESPAEAQEIQRETNISLAENGSNSFLIFAGKITWIQGLPVIDAVRAALEKDHNLLVDLSNCDSMDSAMLGTLHEISQLVFKANKQLVIQGIVTSVRNSFIELGMRDVLANVSGVYYEPPKDRKILSNGDFDMVSHQRWLLHAHETLAGLNAANKDEFAGVIDMLRDELDEISTTPHTQP